MKAVAAFILLLIFAAGAWLGWQALSFLNTPAQKPGAEAYFDVPQGASLAKIADELAAAGPITDARKFTLLARYRGLQNRLQAGRFQLNSGWLPDRVLDTLANGRPVMYKITIPEGLTWWQTAKLLEDAGFVKFADFRDAITDADFLRHYGIPFATAEGFLMPDTYLLRKPDFSQRNEPGPSDEADIWRRQSRAIAGRLIDNFWLKANAVWPGQNSTGQPQRINRPGRRDLQKWVTLASIVEKETGLPAERPRVAGVYENRIRKNMLLQADPTVIYGMGQGFAGELRKSDLANAANPYNTYQNPGLPPGPICSFGIDALNAAISPETHDYLYFVAAGNGPGHVFSRSYGEHEQAVREYRRQKRNK